MSRLLTSRLTPRRLEGPGPDAAQIESALRAARAAPDHGRLRPWRFMVIADDARVRLGETMAAALLKRDHSATADMLETERAKPLRAPLTIVVACCVQPSPKVPEIEQVSACAAAAQNLQLAFHEQGFGCQWKTGPAAYDPHVKAGLGLADSDHIIGFIQIGRIAEAGRARE